MINYTTYVCYGGVESDYHIHVLQIDYKPTVIVLLNLIVRTFSAKSLKEAL